MKLTFENLGALEYAEIETADLTVICGENNTGKTYVTYLVYCLLTTWRQLVDIDLEKEFRDLQQNGVTKINLQEKIADSWDLICTTTLARFKEQFPEMLASKTDLFSKFVVKLDLPLGSNWKEKEFKQDLRGGQMVIY